MIWKYRASVTWLCARKFFRKLVTLNNFKHLPKPKQLSVVAPMRGWYRCVHACVDRHPKGLVWGRVQLTVHNVLFCVQVWSLTKFYRLNGSQIANLTLDSKLTPVLCHHWQVGDVGCGYGVWTPVMKIHGDKVWKKKNNFLICFLQSFCLNLKGFENPSLTRLPQNQPSAIWN